MSQITISVEQHANQASGSISGPLNRDSVAQLSKSAHSKIVNCQAITVDLSQVTHVDTAGLAWLLYIIESAVATKCQLSFVHLPQDLLKLAKLSAVSEFFAS